MEKVKAQLKKITAEEKAYIPLIEMVLKNTSRQSAIRSYDLLYMINDLRYKHEIKEPLTDVRLRKVINYIRTNAMLPIISTSSGYFLSDDPADFYLMIESLRLRAASINAAANGLSQLLAQVKLLKQIP